LYRILYVDDEPPLLEIGKIYLESEGLFSVDTQVSAPAALSLLNEVPFDAVVSDYQMPDMDGIEFLTRVRESGNSIPFLLFTGKGREEVVIQALNKGADFYVQKGGVPKAQFVELAHHILTAVKRKHAEDGLAESKARFRIFFDMINDGIHIYGIDGQGRAGKFLEVNDVACRMLQYSREELLELGPRDITDTRGPPAESVIAGLPANGHTIFESELRKKDGTLLPVEINAHRFTFNGTPAIVSVVRDIAPRRQADAALKESEERFRMLLAHIPSIAVQGYRVDGTTHYWNEASEEIYGYRAEEAIGKNLLDLIIPPEMREEVRGAIAYMAESGCPIPPSELSLMRKDGSLVSVFSSHAVVDRSGGERELFCIDIDLSGLKRAEVALHESEEKFRRLADNAQDMIYRMSLPDGIYQYVSPAAIQVTGYAPEDFYQNPFLMHQRVGLGWQDRFRRGWEALLEGNIPSFSEYPITDPAGKTRWLNQRSVLVRNDAGMPVAVEGIITDITGYRQTEDALRLANTKLKLLSGMTRHDINNQLTMIRGYLSLFGRSLPRSSPSTTVARMMTAATRISDMIRFMKEYEEIGVGTPLWHDGRSLVDGAASQVALGTVSVRNEIPAGTEIFADPLITRVWYNLIDNAVQYGGKITTIRFSVRKEAGNAVILCEDDGDGVPSREKALIFARGYGKNTGMGLFLAREILSITGLGIRENGEPGNGARFEISVPAGSYRSGTSSPAAAPVAETGGAEIPAPGRPGSGR